MNQISELMDSLNGYFGWNKARMSCFVKMLTALVVARTVNLSKLACLVSSDAQRSSRYRRLQRFFAHFTINYDKVAGFIFQLFFVPSEQLYLTMDRTNWQWGKTPINILTLGIVFKGTAIPIYWTLLNKKGNSDTPERIELIEKFINRFGKGYIKGLLADREFIGKDWFGWLLKEKIPFVIRIKSNTITTNSRGLTVDIDALFYGLKPGEQRKIKDKRKVWKHEVYLAGLRLSDGKLLIVASDIEHDEPIKVYGLRWEIETLFGCFKGRGFNFEETHLIDAERIKKMVVMLTIAFCWAHKTGEWQQEVKPIRVKKHGRPAVSLFRYGLDYLTEAIMRLGDKPFLFGNCLNTLQLRPSPGLLGVSL